MKKRIIGISVLILLIIVGAFIYRQKIYNYVCRQYVEYYRKHDERFLTEKELKEIKKAATLPEPEIPLLEVLSEEDYQTFQDIEGIGVKNIKDIGQKKGDELTKELLDRLSNMEKSELVLYKQRINGLIEKYGFEIELVGVKLDWFFIATRWANWNQKKELEQKFYEEAKQWIDKLPKEVKKDPHVNYRIEQVNRIYSVGR